MDDINYYVNVDWKQNRIGLLSSKDLNSSIEVATPPEFPGGVSGIWSPEHLLVASVVSCFMTTFLAIAENSKLNFKAFSCGSKGKLTKLESRFIMTEVELSPHLQLLTESDKEKAERIINKSETACLISNSIKSNVSLKPHIFV